MKRLLPALLLLLPALAALLAVLMYTEAGLHWTLRQIDSRIPGELDYERANGRLAGPLTLSGLRYADDGVRVSVDRLTLDWRPSRLFSGTIHIALLETSGASIATTPPPAEPDRQDKGPGDGLRLPLRIAVDRFAARDSAVTVGEGAPVRINELRLSLSAAGDRAEIRSLLVDMDSPRLRVEGHAHLPLGPDGAVSMEARVRGEYEGHPIEATLTAEGTTASLDATALLAQPLRVQATAHADLGSDTPQWHAAATMEPFGLADLLPEARPLRFGEGRLEARGRGDDIDGHVRISAQDEDFGEWALALDGGWDGRRWEVPRFSASDIGGAARIEGRAGQDPADPRGYFMDARWTQLAWPPRGAAILLSPAGSLGVRGTPEAYRYTVSGELQPTDVPPLALELTGRGDRQGVALDALGASWLGGEWRGAGRLAWSPLPAWTFAVDADGVDLAGLHPDLDGVLGARIEVSGSQADELHMEARVRDLRGEVFGRPLEGGLRAVLAGNTLDVEDLSLASGTAKLQGRGSLGARWDIEWRLRAPELSALVAGIDGAIEAQGRASGPPEALRTQIDLKAQGLALDDHRIDALDIVADLDFSDAGRWQAMLEAEGTHAGGVALGRVVLETVGTRSQHELSLHVEHETHRLAQQVSGSLEEARWIGTLREGLLSQAQFGQWRQRAPASLSVSADAGRLGELCWESEPAVVCLQGGGSDGTAAGTLAWHGLDLQRLEPVLQLEAVEVAGMTAGQVSARYDQGALSARLEAEALQGNLRYAQPQQAGLHTLPYERATLLVLAGDQGVSGEFDLALSATEHLSAELELPGFDPMAPRVRPDQALAGGLELRIGDLTPLALLVPEIHAGEGRANMRLAVSGTVESPRIEGNAELFVSTLSALRLGTRLDDLHIEANMQRNRLELEGGARMGAGELEIQGSGRLEHAGDWQGRLTFSGENLEVLRLPSAQIDASPRITLQLTPQELLFDGTLTIPKAMLEPVRPETSVVVSDDVVIIGGATEEERRPFRSHGRLELIFGDEVTVEGSGFEGRLAGRLVVLIDRMGDMTAQGEVRFVDGRYRAYGQNLVIRQGRVLYAGGPIDDPAIDVIASRTRGDRGEIEVGVRVVGTAQNPAVELYSAPAMDEADVLSYLIIGRPLREARAGEGQDIYQAATSVALAGGEALAERIGERFGLVEISIEAGEEADDTALVLGRSLSPRLYVRYIQGLMEDTNAIQFRYELSDKWTIETESGTRTGAGADILYTLEH